MWQDEIVSARILSEPTPWNMLLHVARTESTPPAWYALGWLVHHMGLDVEAVRALSVLFGTLLAALVVILARRVVPLWAAALAGVLVALGDQLVVHGRELRAYELYALLAVLYALVLVRFSHPSQLGERRGTRNRGDRRIAHPLLVPARRPG